MDRSDVEPLFFPNVKKFGITTAGNTGSYDSTCQERHLPEIDIAIQRIGGKLIENTLQGAGSALNNNAIKTVLSVGQPVKRELIGLRCGDPCYLDRTV
jgi:hypothetical protein